MKKFILLFAILLASCNAPVEEPTGSGDWAGGDGHEKCVNASDELKQPAVFGKKIIFFGFR